MFCQILNLNEVYNRDIGLTFVFFTIKWFAICIIVTTLLANLTDDKLMTVFLFFPRKQDLTCAFYVSQKTGFDLSCKMFPLVIICLKCQILCPWK